MKYGFITGAVVLFFNSQIAYANETHNKLMALTETQRAAFFTTFLQKSGEVCDGVIRTFYQGSEKVSDEASWNVECKDKHTYSIGIRADATGSTIIIGCEELKAANLLLSKGKSVGTECFQKF